MWSRLGLRQKVFLLFSLITVVPLLVINVFWLRSSQNQLKQAAADRQSILLTTSAARVNELLNAKVNNVIARSQDVSVANLDIEQAEVKLLQYTMQDSDILRVALVDNNGNERIVIENGNLSSGLKNVRNSEAYKVVSQFSSNASLSEVVYVNDKPQISLSIPLLSFSGLGEQNLTNAEALARRYGADIKGALIVDISLDSLWKSILSSRLGSNGYIYLVNSKGELIAHPDKKLITDKTDVAQVTQVQAAVELLKAFDLEGTAASYKPQPTVTLSETGTEVLGSFFPISRARWAIIGQEPISSVYSASNRVSFIATIIFIISALIAIGLVMLATRNILTPIRELTKGALRLGGGDFGHHLPAKGGDELAMLAQTFNKMGDGLQNLLERYRAQNVNLEAEQTKLQAVLNTITDGVIVLDQNYNIVLFNNMVKNLITQNEKAPIGAPWLDIFRLTYDDKLFSNQLLTSGITLFHDVVLEVDSKPKYLDITSVRVTNDPNGIAFILTIHDITQRKELENMKLDFVSMAAHELRTPLSAINGYLELISRNVTNYQESQKYLERAADSAAMLGSLINNLLSLSRIERNALKFNMQKIDWLQIVAAEVENHRSAALAKQLTLIFEPVPAPLFVWGDELALREVVGNLLSNAIHYTDNGGMVTVVVQSNPGGITTTVSDTGIGIPESAIPKLFTKYYRTEGGLTTNSQGTGIGLYICKIIIEAHKGVIGVRSKSGKGSDFYFSLPLFSENSSRQFLDSGASIKKRGKIDWFK